jgi:hypothetical protein
MWRSRTSWSIQAFSCHFPVLRSPCGVEHTVQMTTNRFPRHCGWLEHSCYPYCRTSTSPATNQIRRPSCSGDGWRLLPPRAQTASTRPHQGTGLKHWRSASESTCDSPPTRRSIACGCCDHPCSQRTSAVTGYVVHIPYLFLFFPQILWVTGCQDSCMYLNNGHKYIIK